MAAFSTAISLLAQEISSEDTTSGETENPAESSSSDLPVAPTNPDDNTVRAGAGAEFPSFILGRRLRLSLSLTGGYDDNVNLTPTGSPSWFTSPFATLTYQFGNPRFAIDLITGGGITYYFEHPGGRDYDPNVYLRLSAQYKSTERLTFDLEAFLAYQSQPDVSTALSVNRQLGNYFRTIDELSAHYRWTPRFSTITGYNLAALEYESTIGSAHNRIEQAFTEEGRYLLFPTTTVTGQYRFSLVNYQQNTSRDSNTNTLTAGLEQTFSPHLEASFHAGAQFRSQESGGGRTSPYVETSLHYTFNAKTTLEPEPATYVIWTGRYGLEESDLPGGSSRETFRTNLQVVYAITTRISATLTLTYSNSNNPDNSSGTAKNVGESHAETIFDIGPEVRYLMTRNLSFNVGYRYTESDRGPGVTTVSTFGTFNSYTRNRYFAGITYTF